MKKKNTTQVFSNIHCKKIFQSTGANKFVLKDNGCRFVCIVWSRIKFLTWSLYQFFYVSFQNESNHDSPSLPVFCCFE